MAKLVWTEPALADVDDLREILVGVYRIIYRILEDTCFIIAVAHGSRDLTRLIEPDDRSDP